MKASHADPNWGLALQWVKSLKNPDDACDVPASICNVLTQNMESIAPNTVRKVCCAVSGTLASDMCDNLILVRPCPFYKANVSDSYNVSTVHNCNTAALCQIVEGLVHVGVNESLISVLVEKVGSDEITIPPLTKVALAHRVQLSEQLSSGRFL